MNRLLFVLTLYLLPIFASAQEAVDSTVVDSLTRELKEVVVEAVPIRHLGNQTTVTITRAMRKNAESTAEMLGNIPGITVNRAHNSVEYMGHSDIKFLVDSMEKDEEYIKNLGHLRFDRVDIIRNPGGRYADYSILINLHTRENYEGYEGFASAKTNINPAYDKGYAFSRLNTGISFTYTWDKWTISTSPGFSFRRDQSDILYSNTKYPYNNLQEIIIPNPGGEPSSRPYVRGKGWDLNIDYQFNKNHSISATYYYAKQDDDTYRHSTILSGALDASVLDTISIRRVSRDNGFRHTYALFYKGRIDGWNLWIGANYNHNPWCTREHTERSSGFMLDDNLRQQLNFTWVNADISHNFFDGKLSTGIGYENLWRRHRIKEMETLDILTTSTERRNRWYLSTGYNISPSMHLRLDGGMTFLSSISGGIKENHTLWNLRAEISKDFKGGYVSINYERAIRNPLSQSRQDYGQFTDSITWNGGNPLLKSSTNNYISLYGSALDNTLSIRGSLSINPDEINNIVEERTGMRPDGTVGPYIAIQPQNTYNRSWDIGITYRRRFKRARPSATIGWRDSYASYNGKSYRENGIRMIIGCEYEISEKDFYASVEYRYLPTGFVSPQGYTKGKLDHATIILQKRFFKRQLEIMIEYLPPIHLVSGESRSWAFSPVMNSYTVTNAQKLKYNSMYITLRYRISGGKSVRHYRRTLFNE